MAMASIVRTDELCITFIGSFRLGEFLVILAREAVRSKQENPELHVGSRGWKSVDETIFLAPLVKLIDVACLMASGYVASEVRPISTRDSEMSWTLILMIALVYFVFGGQANEVKRRENWKGYTKLLSTVTIITLAIAAPFSKLVSFGVIVDTMLPFLAIFGLIAAIDRAIVAVGVRQLRKLGKGLKEVIVYGAGAEGQRCVRHLLKYGDCGYRVKAVLDNRRTRVPSMIEGVPVYFGVDTVGQAVADFGCREVIIALPWLSAERIDAICSVITGMPVKIRLATGTSGGIYLNPTADLGSSNADSIGFLDLVDEPLDARQRIYKRFFDLLGSAILLMFLAPLIGMIALAIRLDSPGAVLFRQVREGLGNCRFKVFKFRTLYEDRADLHCVQQAGISDPRVTRVGKFLRATGLDELPQLLNVLRGEMSLVGPRPHAVGMTVSGKRNHEVIAEYRLRHSIKPGITGWAQINGSRGPIDNAEALRNRVNFDLHYVKHGSDMSDLSIMLMTVARLLADVAGALLARGEKRGRTTGSGRTLVGRFVGHDPQLKRRSQILRKG
jgi:exopolysaccharide biosynthesis polyprenyl glycosylphosphotransferase